MNSPRLSIIVTSRNDDHGGNLLARMQLFINGLVTQCDEFHVPAELILVEWNPPEDKPRLREALSWPQSKMCEVRIIEVPADLHQTLENSERLPLFQMIAKNVGIRRARGTFVLATNIDILFTGELIAFMGSRLKKGRYYRVNRYDVPIPPGGTLGEQLKFCRANVIRVAERDGTRTLATGNYSHAHPPVTWLGRIKDRMSDYGLSPVIRPVRLHTNACGDFTLMAKADWFSLRGYAEWPIFSFHLDSLLCHAAHNAGVREKFLGDPMRIYHIDHAEGSGWTPEGENALINRLAKTGIRKLTNQEVEDLAIQMRRDGKPILFNDEDWGFAAHDLPEVRIHG